MAALSTALLLALGLPLAAGAKEESKIQVPLVDDSNPGNGNGKAKGRNDGKMQSTFTERQATFHVHAKQLTPLGEYELLARESEDTLPEDAQLIQAFTAGSNGQVNLKIDLFQTGHTADPPTAPIDPRGKLISIHDPSLGVDVMSGWFYGDAINDTPHTKVKEQTELDPVDEATTGSVSARYNMGPNGKGSFNLQLQNVAPDTLYEIHVEGAPENPIETLTTNAGGTAKLTLRTHPGKGKGIGNGKAHNKKGTLPSDLDPRRKLIEVMQGGVPVFSGPMLAQIPGLNDCGLGEETIVDMVPAPGLVDIAGEVTTGVDESCAPIFGVAISGLTTSDLPVGDYTLVVDGFEEGTIAVTEDLVTGETSGELRFAANPVAGELPLLFPVGSGSLVEVVQGTTPFFSVTLP